MAAVQQVFRSSSIDRCHLPSYQPPSDQTANVSPRPERRNVSQIPDIEDLDAEKFPLFTKATSIRFKLEPGEILFVPSGLGHTARILSPSITVSLNRANASNWSNVTHDVCADTRPSSDGNLHRGIEDLSNTLRFLIVPPQA
jgi:hypothetical protein